MTLPEMQAEAIRYLDDQIQELENNIYIFKLNIIGYEFGGDILTSNQKIEKIYWEKQINLYKEELNSLKTQRSKITMGAANDV